MTQNNESVTHQEILAAINDFATQIDAKLLTLATKDELRQFENKMNTKMETMESRMVSKSYLDDKLADLISDQSKLMRKEDNKLKTLVGILHHNRTISNHDLSSIAVLEPFPEHL